MSKLVKGSYRQDNNNIAIMYQDPVRLYRSSVIRVHATLLKPSSEIAIAILLLSINTYEIRVSPER